jgi:1-acyl-sn-glycerol-3-phosphate acyltransferase
MISSNLAKLINYLPKRLVVLISKKIVNIYLNKYADIKVTGKEKLNKVHKPSIFICNHLSNADGIILDKVLKDQDVTFVAGVKLSNDPVTSIGINIVKTIQIKPNTADKEALTKLVKIVKEGNSILIFPEGTRSRTGSMIEAKKGILLIAKLTKAPIVPIGVWGTEKLLPINEQGEMSKENFQHSVVNINIGDVISIVEKGENEDRHQYEDRALGELMRNIAKLLPETYRGIYK